MICWATPALSRLSGAAAAGGAAAAAAAAGRGGRKVSKRPQQQRSTPTAPRDAAAAAAAAVCAPSASAPSLHRGLFVVDKPPDVCIDDAQPIAHGQRADDEHAGAGHASTGGHGRRSVTLERLALKALHEAADALARQPAPESASASATASATAAATSAASELTAAGESNYAQAAAAAAPSPCPSPPVPPRLRLCHQLDLATSGLLAYALDADTARRLCDLFAARRVHKTYLALVHGHVEADLSVRDEPLGSSAGSGGNSGNSGDSGGGGALVPASAHFCERMGDASDPGRPAVTLVHVLERGYLSAPVDDSAGGASAVSPATDASAASPAADPRGSPASLVALLPQSGRRHQLRLHLAHMGHGIVGDLAYGSPPTAAEDQRADRMMLHAWRLQIPIERAAAAAESADACRPCGSVFVHSCGGAEEGDELRPPLSPTTPLAADSSLPSPTAATCTTADGSSWLSLQTRSNPFASLLSASQRTSLYALHERHAHVHSARLLRSALGGVLLLARDDEGRVCALLAKQPRSLVPFHHGDVTAAAIDAPLLRQTDAASLPVSQSEAETAVSSSAHPPAAPAAGVLTGSVWTLPHSLRVPNDADVADAAARAIAALVSPAMLLRSLDGDLSPAPLSAPAAASSSSATTPTSDQFAALTLARRLRRVHTGSPTLAAAELPHAAVSQTYFLVRASRASSAAALRSPNAVWLPLADLLAHSSAASASASSLLRSGGRSWVVSPLLLALCQHPAARSWLSPAESSSSASVEPQSADPGH